MFQNGERDDQSNYKPISVLSALSKLFEKLAHDQLYNERDNNKHLYIFESGFRILHLVVTCLYHDDFLNL